MSCRHGLSIRAADNGDVNGLAELIRTAGFAIAHDRLASRLSAIRDQPGALIIADE